MDPLVADRRLKNMVAWQCAPCITQEDIAMLLALAQIEDPNGNQPNETPWTPTYDLNYAAREAWAWKAGAAADHYWISPARAVQFHRDQIYDHCVAMYRLYDTKVSARPHSLRATGNLVEDRLSYNPTPWWWEISA